MQNSQLQTLETRVLSAISGGKARTRTVSYDQPRIVPTVVGGQIFWVEPRAEVSEYKETRKSGVIIAVEYYLDNEKVSVSLASEAA